MTNISEVNNFDTDVKRYDLTDPVVGDLTGESNMPIIALANRTRFLYNYLNGRNGVTSITADTTVNATHLRQLLFVNISTNITITIAALSNFLDGQRLSFIVKTTGVKCAKFVPADGSIINMPPGYTGLWLHDGEEIELERISNTQWWLHDVKTNLEKVASDGLVRIMPANAVLATAAGSPLYNRADYARAWDRVSTNNLSVTEATWVSDVLNYRCLFSNGNGTSTFRFPDMRSISWRGLDLSRGISAGRLGTTPGSYEADQLGEFEDTTGNAVGGTPVPSLSYSSGAAPFRTQTINPGKETTIKNVGLIPVIYY